LKFYICQSVAVVVQGAHWQSEGGGDSADLVPAQSLLFDDHFGDSYQRVQRIRAKKVTSWMEKPTTLSVLISASLCLSPLERLMPEPQEGNAARLEIVPNVFRIQISVVRGCQSGVR